MGGLRPIERATLASMQTWQVARVRSSGPHFSIMLNEGSQSCCLASPRLALRLIVFFHYSWRGTPLLRTSRWDALGYPSATWSFPLVLTGGGRRDSVSLSLSLSFFLDVSLPSIDLLEFFATLSHTHTHCTLTIYCKYIYICMWLCIYTHMHIYIYIVCTQCTYYIYILYIYTHLHAYIHIYTFIVYIYISIYIYIYTHTYIYIYIYIGVAVSRFFM